MVSSLPLQWLSTASTKVPGSWSANPFEMVIINERVAREHSSQLPIFEDFYMHHANEDWVSLGRDCNEGWAFLYYILVIGIFASSVGYAHFGLIQEDTRKLPSNNVQLNFNSPALYRRLGVIVTSVFHSVDYAFRLALLEDLQIHQFII